MLDVEYLNSILQNGNIITKELFSLNILEISLEYFLCSFLIFFILRDKELAFVKNNIDKKQLFLGQIITVILSVGLAFIVFLLVKMIFIFLRKDIYGDYRCFKSLIIFVFLHFNLCLLSSCVVYLFNMMIKDRITALILPIIFIQIPFILFGLTTTFNSVILLPFKKVGEFLNLIFFDKFILGFFMGSRLELLSFSKQWMLIVLIVLLSISVILIAYSLFIKLNENNLKNAYYFKASKIFCHLNLAIIFSYLTSIILSFVVMFFNTSKGVEFASFIFSILYIILIPIYYIIQNFVYRKFNGIIIKS